MSICCLHLSIRGLNKRLDMQMDPERPVLLLGGPLRLTPERWTLRGFT